MLLNKSSPTGITQLIGQSTTTEKVVQIVEQTRYIEFPVVIFICFGPDFRFELW